MDSQRLVGTRSSSHAWRRNCNLQDVVPVRALLSDCNTARKVANRPRAPRQASKAFAASVKSGELGAERDEAAAEVLSIGYFTTLQVLFAIFLYSPLMICAFPFAALVAPFG